MFSEHTFSFVALHKIITNIVKHLGSLTAFHLNHGDTLESLCNEFEDRDDDLTKKEGVVKDGCKEKDIPIDKF